MKVVCLIKEKYFVEIIFQVIGNQNFFLPSIHKYPVVVRKCGCRFKNFEEFQKLVLSFVLTWTNRASKDIQKESNMNAANLYFNRCQLLNVFF